MYQIYFVHVLFVKYLEYLTQVEYFIALNIGQCMVANIYQTVNFPAFGSNFPRYTCIQILYKVSTVI